MIDGIDYGVLHSIVFSGNYPGYRPEVKEIPNGDGKVDADKRFAHIADKYLDQFDDFDKHVLEGYLDYAHNLSLRMATVLGVPKEFTPVRKYGALRVLEYPVGAVSNEHSDFDLFTLMLYRNQPDKFISDWHDMPAAARELNPQAHLGELAEEIGVGRAVKHSVLASDTRQCSMVYFAIPDHEAVLPNGMTVGQWLIERMNRSRVGWTPVGYK